MKNKYFVESGTWRQETIADSAKNAIFITLRNFLEKQCLGCRLSSMVAISQHGFVQEIFSKSAFRYLEQEEIKSRRDSYVVISDFNKLEGDPKEDILFISTIQILKHFGFKGNDDLDLSVFDGLNIV